MNEIKGSTCSLADAGRWKKAVSGDVVAEWRL